MSVLWSMVQVPLSPLLLVIKVVAKRLANTTQEIIAGNMRVLLAITLATMMTVCATAEDPRASLKEAFMHLSRDQQEDRIKALLVRGFLDEKLREFLEIKVPVILKNGSEAWGLPSMDPYTQKHMDINLDEEQVQLNATVDELRAEKLSVYDVNIALFDLGKQNISFELLFGELIVMAEHYWLDSMISNMLPIYGEGSIDVRITNLIIGGYIVIGVNGSYINLKEVSLDVTIGGIWTNITGLLGGGELSDLINEIISGSAPAVWENLKPDVMPQINKFIEDFGSEALSGLTFQDIIDLIMG